MKVLIINWMDATHPEAGGHGVGHEFYKRLVGLGHKVILLCHRYRGAKEQEVIDGVEIIRRGGLYTFNLAVFWVYFTKLWKDCDVIVEDLAKVPFFLPTFGKPKVAMAHHLFKGVYLREVPFLLIPIIWFTQVLLSLFYKKVSIIAYSMSTKSDLMSIGIPEGNIKFVQLGLDHEAYKPDFSSKSKEPSVLYLSRIKPYKNVDHAIRALAKVRETLPDATLSIAGQGGAPALYRKLQALAEELGVERAVRFHGEVTAAEKVRLYQSAWVFVQPSAKEGWGQTVIESNACGTPAVGYSVPGLRDSIRNDETGRLIPYGDVEGLAEALSKILGDPALRERLTENSLKWASSFSWDKAAEVFEGVLEDTVNGKGPR
jgi:glycosyltransferase involved in cell wall biosynthesis